MTDPMPRSQLPRRRSRLRRVLIALLLLPAAALLLTLSWFLLHASQRHHHRLILIHDPGISASAAGSPPPSSLRLATFNISMGRGLADGADLWAGGPPAERRQRCDDIGAWLASQDADLVVLTEVDFDSTWSGRFNMAERIARAGRYPWRVEQRNADLSLPAFRIATGNALLSRHPVSSASFIELPNPGGFIQRMTASHDPHSPVQTQWRSHTENQHIQGLRHAFRARVDLPDGQRLAVLGVHMPLPAPLKHAAASVLAAHIQDSALPSVLMGDFNAQPAPNPRPDASGPLEILLVPRGPLATDLPPPPFSRMLSFPAHQPKNAIDWILATPPLQLLHQQAHPLLLSDHLPVLADLHLSAKKEPVN